MSLNGNWGAVRVPGCTARTLRWSLVSCAIVTFVSGAIAVALSFVNLWPISMAIVVTCWISCELLARSYKRRLKDEVRAGYTTHESLYPQVVQRDPRTGIVIRDAGEPLLSSKVRREREQAARASHT